MSAAGTYSYITNFTKTANDQANLQSSFPIGLFTTSNSFATPFDVTSDVTGKNFSEISGSGSHLVISNIDLPNVVSVFTIMNAYAPVSGPLASVEFLGSGGAEQAFTLSGGVDIRDFFQGSWQNTINGTTTRNAYQIDNARGAAATGDSSTGLVGTYRFDEQQFVLPNSFLGQSLTTIIISNLNGNSTPFVLAITAEQLNRPILSIQPETPGFVALSWPAIPTGFRLQQTSMLGSTNWEPTTNAVSFVNGTNQVSVASTHNASYFRLINP